VQQGTQGQCAVEQDGEPVGERLRIRGAGLAGGVAQQLAEGALVPRGQPPGGMAGVGDLGRGVEVRATVEPPVAEVTEQPQEPVAGGQIGAGEDLLTRQEAFVREPAQVRRDQLVLALEVLIEGALGDVRRPASSWSTAWSSGPPTVSCSRWPRRSGWAPRSGHPSAAAC
jgi:hypothetical protein